MIIKQAALFPHYKLHRQYSMIPLSMIPNEHLSSNNYVTAHAYLYYMLKLNPSS